MIGPGSPSVYEKGKPSTFTTRERCCLAWKLWIPGLETAETALL